MCLILGQTQQYPWLAEGGLYTSLHFSPCAQILVKNTESQNPFQSAIFLKSAEKPRDFVPDTGAEIAFAGRSNAGKSSAINRVLNRRSLARTSKTPGRTQLINFFQVADDLRFVDLPGYGFAQVPTRVQRQWRAMMGDYFRQRESLTGVVLVMDIRRGLTDFDRQMLDWIGPTGLRCLLLLTKADKLKRQAQALTLREIKKTLSEIPDFSFEIQTFSAQTGLGVEQARQGIQDLFQKKGPSV